jgi:Protein of unknown function (DUF2852)
MAGGASWAEAWGPGVQSGPESSGDAGRSGNSLRFLGREWRTWEVVAMILGFIVFWPIGLAILLFKLWGGRMMCRHGDAREWASRHWRKEMRRSGLSRDSGNMAFEEYKAAEVERLERERQRLADEQKAFGDFLNDLKRAKDREEFDRFMSSRRGPIVDNGEGAPA